MPDEPHEQPTTPEDLGRTYAAMVGEQAWQADMPAEAVAAPIEDATPPAPLMS